MNFLIVGLTFIGSSLFSLVDGSYPLCYVSTVKSAEDLLGILDPNVIRQSQPWMVQIIKGKEVTCTGVVIQGVGVNVNSGTSYFVTNYMCMDDVLASDHVLVGALQERFQVKGLKITYDRKDGRAAVVMLTKSVSFSQHVKPVCIFDTYTGEHEKDETTILAKYVKNDDDTYKLDIKGLSKARGYVNCDRDTPNNGPCQVAGSGSPIIVYKKVKAQVKKDGLFGNTVEMTVEAAHLDGLVREVINNKLIYTEIPDRGFIDAAIKDLQATDPERVTFQASVTQTGPTCYGWLVRVEIATNKVTSVAVTNPACGEMIKNAKEATAILHDGEKAQHLEVFPHLHLEKYPMVIVKLGNKDLAASKISGGGFRLSKDDTKADTANYGIIIYQQQGKVAQADVNTLSPSDCKQQLNFLLGHQSDDHWLCLESRDPLPSQGIGTDQVPYYVKPEQNGLKTMSAVGGGNNHYFANIDHKWVIDTVKEWPTHDH